MSPMVSHADEAVKVSVARHGCHIVSFICSSSLLIYTWLHQLIRMLNGPRVGENVEW